MDLLVMSLVYGSVGYFGWRSVVLLVGLARCADQRRRDARLGLLERLLREADVEIAQRKGDVTAAQTQRDEWTTRLRAEHEKALAGIRAQRDKGAEVIASLRAEVLNHTAHVVVPSSVFESEVRKARATEAEICRLRYEAEIQQLRSDVVVLTNAKNDFERRSRDRDLFAKQLHDEERYHAQTKRERDSAEALRGLRGLPVPCMKEHLTLPTPHEGGQLHLSLAFVGRAGSWVLVKRDEYPRGAFMSHEESTRAWTAASGRIGPYVGTHDQRNPATGWLGPVPTPPEMRGFMR